MFNQARSGWLRGMNRRLFWAALLLVLLSTLMGSVYAQATAELLAELRTRLNPILAWYYVLLVGFLLFFMIWLGTGRYKNVRLGNDDEAPEFTFFSWVTMLFAAGTGVGILFWSVAQPVLQFHDNPFTDSGSAQDAQAAITAMRLAFFHWGINGWAIFAFIGLSLAYFSFRHDLPLTIRSALYPLLGERVKGPLGDLVDLLAVFATVFGIATTLGLGVQQLSSGLQHVFDWQASNLLQLSIIAIIMSVATLSVASGVQRGVRLLSESNFWLSLIAVSLLLLLGPTQYLIGLTIEASGDYIQNLLRMTFHTNVTHATDWQAQWTVFFWGWWLAWSPFVGLFIARISRGRTFREYVMGVLLVPTLITIVWIGLFGGTALYHELFGNGGIVAAVQNDVAGALFVTIDALDLGGFSVWLSALLILLITTYLITSANAGTLVINTILSGGDADPAVYFRVLWGVLLAILTAVLLVAGGLETLQSAVIAAALPFSLVVIVMLFGLVRALENERFAARAGMRRSGPTEPWLAETKAPEHSTIILSATDRNPEQQHR